MNNMTNDTVLSELQELVPNFRMDPESLKDELRYPIFNEFARFICSEAEVLQFVGSEAEVRQLSQVPVSMEYLDKALCEGDDDVRALVVECIETLAACKWVEQIKRYFGPEVRRVWASRFSSVG
jgi:hypothetical protein